MEKMYNVHSWEIKLIHWSQQILSITYTVGAVMDTIDYLHQQTLCVFVLVTGVTR